MNENKAKYLLSKQNEKVKLNTLFHLGVFLVQCQQEHFHSWLAPKKHFDFDKSDFCARNLYNQKNINQHYCIRRTDMPLKAWWVLLWLCTGNIFLAKLCFPHGRFEIWKGAVFLSELMKDSSCRWAPVDRWGESSSLLLVFQIWR